MKTLCTLVLILVLPASEYNVQNSGGADVRLPGSAGIDAIEETTPLILGDVEAFRAEIRQHPDSPEAYYKLGIACLHIPVFPGLVEAREAFKHAIALKPDYAEAYNGLGFAYHGFQFGLVIYGTQYKFAVKAHEKAIALRPDYSEAYLGLGIARWGLEQYQEAIEAYQQAIKLRPDYPEAYSCLSQAYQNSGRYDDAAAAHQQMMGLVYGQRESAEQRTGISPWAKSLNDEYMDYNQLGRLYTEAGQYEKAVDAHREAIRLNPHEPMLYHNLGLTYLKSGDKESALGQYNLLMSMLRKPGYGYDQQIIQNSCEDLYYQIKQSP